MVAHVGSISLAWILEGKDQYEFVPPCATYLSLV